MSRDIWDHILSELAQAHGATPSTRAFAPFPTDVAPQTVDAFHIPAAELFVADRQLQTGPFAKLAQGLVAASPHATWRETYKDTDIGDDFMTRFGCYCIIGGGGAFTSAQLWAWVVYMPAHLHYPWHHHPAEEMYLVLSGEAEFHRHGEPSETLRTGDTSYHASNQPHAMTTLGHPVMALVMWRNGFETPPVLTQ